MNAWMQDWNIPSVGQTVAQYKRWSANARTRMTLLVRRIQEQSVTELEKFRTDSIRPWHAVNSCDISCAFRVAKWLWSRSSAEICGICLYWYAELSDSWWLKAVIRKLNSERVTETMGAWHRCCTACKYSISLKWSASCKISSDVAVSPSRKIKAASGCPCSQFIQSENLPSDDYGHKSEIPHNFSLFVHTKSEVSPKSLNKSILKWAGRNFQFSLVLALRFWRSRALRHPLISGTPSHVT